MFRAPFSLFASSNDAQAATILSAGPKGKQARSWCIGWRELPPIPGGLLMNIVCTDFIFYPQKLFRYGMSFELVQQLCRTSSNWKSCSFVIEDYPLSYLPLFFLTRAMSLTTCIPGGLDIRKMYGESFLSQQSRNLCFHIWMSLSLRKFLITRYPFSSQKSLCSLVRQPASVVQRYEFEFD